jgi:cellulose synthase/poly-beta-1,6-N-acetylglucosamine synthase-like glycosyltransferase
LDLFALDGRGEKAIISPKFQSPASFHFSSALMFGTPGAYIWTLSYLAVLAGFSAYGIHRWLIIFLFLKNRRHAPKPDREFDELPVVTVQLPIYNERYVAERLLRAVAEIDYPRDRLEIQVLDDSTDDTRDLIEQEVAVLRATGLDVKMLHRDDRTGFKAGALENGMHQARGEFIFILDADFLPKPDILHRTIHFFTNPQVGMIQTRWGHLNRTYSLLTRVQAMFLDGHLLLEQTARSRSGRFFNFNGTAGIWRRSCIEAAGGWQHDTLTEDLDLSYRAQLAGWKFIFLSDVVTPAELPVDMNGFKSQQHRWTKGSIQTCKKLLPRILRSNLPWKIKLEAILHLTSNFSYLLLAFLCVLLQPNEHIQVSWMRYLLFDTPVFLAASVSVAVFYICAQRELYPRSWMKEILLLPPLIALGIGLSLNNARAVLEAIFNRGSAFVRTPKYGIERPAQSWRHCRYSPIRSLLPLLELCFAIYFTYVTYRAAVSGEYASLPFLLLFQMGFCYVAFSSLGQWVPARWRGAPPALAA